MESGTFYVCRNITNRSGTRTQIHLRDEGKDRGGSRRLVLMTVCLGIICVVLLVFIILQHISNTAERESLFKSNKNTVEEFNQTINRSQDENTNQMTEKDQLKNNFNSLSQKNLELETRVNDLTAEKKQLQGRVDSLNQKKVELESKVTSLSDELKLKGCKEGQRKLELENELRNISEQGNGRFFISDEEKSWSDSRQYCRDRGGDLVIIDTEVKQRSISSFIKASVWIGLSDIENEGNMKWVDNSTMKQGFFFPNEPNDAHGNEDCVEMQYCTYCSPSDLNVWNDRQCSDLKKALCEK
ncbi:CD209 antigen-like protein B [Megalobrama amblycephala]|uniref:CD209 antigen-like protein B n=1 Tax=Megalobrama amblycephala TaxID=75352 RepID=UPI002014437F|nr:CD209 antigen-like protein B [Megalobrama amblycephala]